MKKEVRKKCNGCGEEMCRNIPTMVKHINEDCKKRKTQQKYNIKGNVITQAPAPHPCNWSNRTGPQSLLTEDELYSEEMEVLHDENNITNDMLVDTATQRQRRKRKRISMIKHQNVYELNGMYSKMDIRRYASPVPPMTKDEKEHSHGLFAKAFMLCDIPAAVIDKPSFQDALRSLRPDYKPVHSTVLSTTYFDKWIDEDDKLLQKEFKDQKVFSMMDGSDNGAKYPVTHTVFIGNSGPRIVSVKYHDAGTTLNAELLYKDLIHARDLLNNLSVNVTLGAYFHDNEKTEKKVGKIFVQKEKRGEAGCGPHGFNKVNHYVLQTPEYDAINRTSNKLMSKINKGRIRQIIEKNINRQRIESNILKKARKENNDLYLRQPDLLKEVVEKKLETWERMVGFPDPGQTRQWSNMISRYNFFIDNEFPIKHVEEQKDVEQYVSDQLKEMLNDNEFWDTMKIQAVKLLPINEGLVALQSNAKNLADTYYYLNSKLPERFADDDEKEIYLNAFQKGFNLIKSDMYFAAISIDPRYIDEEDLSLNDLKRSEAYFKLVLGDDNWNIAIETFYNLRTGSDVFDHSLFTQCDPSMDKYKASRGFKICKASFKEPANRLFIDECEFLMKSPTGIVILEKTFCSYRRLHTWFRINLARSKCAKIVRYRSNHKLRKNLF